MEEYFIDNQDKKITTSFLSPFETKKKINTKEKTVFNEEQIKGISKYLMDLSKLLFGSAIVGFFIPGYSGKVSTAIFIIGVVSSMGLFASGIFILKSIKSQNKNI